MPYVYRKACPSGIHWMSYGMSEDGKPLPGEPCLCDTYEVCRYCDHAHIWIDQCRKCGAQKGWERLVRFNEAAIAQLRAGTKKGPGP